MNRTYGQIISGWRKQQWLVNSRLVNSRLLKSRLVTVNHDMPTKQQPHVKYRTYGQIISRFLAFTLGLAHHSFFESFSFPFLVFTMSQSILEFLFLEKITKGSNVRVAE